MGTSLTGKQIKNTYKSLIKVSDNTEASASAKQLSDGNGNDFGVYIDTDGVFGIGSAPSYSLDVSSRTDGVALPVGTTANRPTGFNGLIRYNSTIGKVEFYDTGWKTIYTTSGGTISGDVTVTGDLVVQGTTVTLNTETVQFEDNILMLNRASSNTQYNATNAGIELEKTDADNPSFLYTYSDSTWTATDNFKIEGNLTVDTNTLYVDATNNRVGIGTTSPTEILDVRGSIKIGKDGTSPYLTFDEVPDSATGSEFYLTHDISGNILKFTDDNSNDLIAMDRDTGNVGIGTTLPSAILHSVKTDSEQGMFSGYSDTGANGASGKIVLGNNTAYQGVLQYAADGNTVMYIDNTYDSASAKTQFRMRTAGTDVNALTILGSGNVGIGTTASTNSRLNVTSSSAIDDVIRWTDAVSDTGYLGIDSSGGVKVWAGGFLSFGAGGGGSFTERVRIGSSGNVIFKGGGAWADNTGNLQLNWTTNEGVISTYYDNHKLTLGSGVSYKNRIEIEGHAAGDGAIKFYTSNLAAATERLRIGSSGSVIHKGPTGTGTNLQESWYYGTDSNYRLDLNQIVSAGLIKHSFDTVNAGTTYSNNLVLDRGNVGIGGTTQSINWTDSPTLTIEGTSPLINLVDTTASSDDYNILNDNGNFRIFNDTDSRFDFNIDGTGNVGIGTSSPNSYSNLKALTINGLSGSLIDLEVNGTLKGEVFASTSNLNINAYDAHNIAFTTGAGTERMRITSGGAIHLSQGTGNSYIGTSAGNLGTSTGTSNTGFGEGALYSNTTGANNVAIGRVALYYNTTGTYNTANGYNALNGNTTGNYNTANGYNSLSANTTGLQNTAVGALVLVNNTTGNYNTANGYASLYSNTTGNENTGNGYAALYANTTGYQNTGNGYAALNSNTTGYSNTANGFAALFSNTTGANNTANGYGSLYSNTTGNNNVAIGLNSGLNITTGSNNSFLGYNAQASSATVSNEITLGDANVTSLRCNTQTISSLSDARDKTNVEDLPLGLDFVDALRPVKFDWDRRDGTMSGVKDAGFIAQELDEAQSQYGCEDYLGLVYKNNPEKLEASYGKLVPVLVKAIQELKAEVESLKQQIS